MEKIIVDELDNIRLDSYISGKCKDLSRESIQRLLHENNITVNGIVKKNSYKVKKGDIINIVVPEAIEAKIEAQDIPIEIVITIFV